MPGRYTAPGKFGVMVAMTKHGRKHRFEKALSQPRRYHQWSQAVMGLTFDENANPIFPETYRDNAVNWKKYKHIVGRCEHCGSRENLTSHHIVSRSQGGVSVLDNIEVLCRDCHDMKDLTGGWHRWQTPGSATRY
jgi:hypothetical protein